MSGENLAMRIRFSKYHGTGNDFIIIDNRMLLVQLSEKQVASLCHRRFGIGADGLIMIEESEVGFIKMRYYNSDGIEAGMCGNGGRCVAAWVNNMDPGFKNFVFEAADGLHKAEVNDHGNGLYQVKLSISDVFEFEKLTDGYFIHTGSPHFVVFTSEAEQMDVVGMGRQLRYDERFQPYGANVNFVSFQESAIAVRTYERGVEDETLSCGTGVTASAIAAFLHSGANQSKWKIYTRGGELMVSSDFDGQGFGNIILEGPARFLFHGEIENLNDW